MAVAAVVVLVLGLAAPAWAERLDRFLQMVGAVIAAVVSWVALGVVWALSIGPAWLIGRVARREPLRPKGG
ncbi:MAG: hypothetical protein AAGK32_15955, partial [Actinomycetota bacterium]